MDPNPRLVGHRVVQRRLELVHPSSKPFLLLDGRLEELLELRLRRQLPPQGLRLSEAGLRDLGVASEARRSLSGGSPCPYPCSRPARYGK